MKEQTQTMAADAFTIKSYQKNAKVGNCVWNWNLIFLPCGSGWLCCQNKGCCFLLLEVIWVIFPTAYG